MKYAYKIADGRIFIRLREKVCQSPQELVASGLFMEVLEACAQELKSRNSYLLQLFPDRSIDAPVLEDLRQTLAKLTQHQIKAVAKEFPPAKTFVKDKELLFDFVEHLYNFWRAYNRYIICPADREDLDKKPYRTFNDTVEDLMHLVRQTYRDVEENITGDHPRIYRQVCAGAEIGTIAAPSKVPYPKGYEKLNEVLMIRQILINPPLVFNPPMNKRKGKFYQIEKNPVACVDLNPEEWLCYPAKVGALLIYVYFHEKFFALGLSLSNLFELAGDHEISRKPDAVYLCGVPGDELDSFGEFPTVFFDDAAQELLVGAIPNRDEFGYFGYLKKMILTLHNIKIMKRNKMPFHGALVKVTLKGNKEASLLMMGDSGAGKSETLEAFRELGAEHIQDIIVIADDMGSLDIDAKGKIIGYGTETGAFLRLDDLSPGYALGQIDRAIIMSPSEVNARIVLPVTTFANLIKGYPVDFVLYANNYEMIDEEHPLIQRFMDPEEALNVFREGNVMSKGTTTSTGLVHTYFANVFGPPQFKELHEKIAQRFFKAFFDQGLFVGQMRTRLGISGWERKGPEEAAKELLKIIQQGPVSKMTSTDSRKKKVPAPR